MSEGNVAPYGSWRSPIQAGAIAAGTMRLSLVSYDAGELYWVEGRPTEGGRQVIVRRAADGKVSDVNPAPSNARTLVHEYGGGTYLVHDGVCYFSNFADQRIYKVHDATCTPITSEGKCRYADFAFDAARNRLICVREDHSQPGEAVTTIAGVSLTAGKEAGDGDVLISGCTFYSNPRVSPDGSKLAWLQWNHPNMPWDGTELYVGWFDEDGTVGSIRKIAGGENESIFQPEWSPDGTLFYISDHTHFWNLYAMREPIGASHPEHLIKVDHDFGMPMWTFGTSSFVPFSDTELVCCYNIRGMWHLAIAHIDFEGGKHRLEDVQSPFTEFMYFCASNAKVAMCAGSPTQPNSVVEFDWATKAPTVIRSSSDVVPDAEYISIPQILEFESEYGRTSYAFFYPPTNADFQAPHGELPPLLVRSHGGPTGAASSTLNLGIQYWTSRGFAVADVNYGGSTGLGRAYRERLLSRWGIVDVADCQHAAHHLVDHGMVDKHRLAITGGSAGGYTTLCALTFGETFKAGASHFGVSDLEALTADTHKFESRYLDRLVGPYPQAREIYYERSPIHFTERLSCPVIFFQGLEDKVVPPNQAEMMVKALKTQHLPVAYIAYEGEQHGFRKAENIRRTLDAEFYFYSRIFGFEPADEIEPVAIENLS